MAAVIRHKIPAATIIETMVAMTILLVLFGMAITLFVQVSVTGNSGKKIRAEQLLNEFAVKTREAQQYEDAEVAEDEFLLRRSVKSRDSAAGLLEIQYSIYDVDKKRLLDRKELIVHEEAR